MFSVIIPLYNKELSIYNTIQSILIQSYKDFEIVIVNDGSTDKSVEVVEKIKDDRIRLIHQENQGVSAARNTGIKHAKHEWICFLDADDLWEKEHLDEYCQVLIKHSQIHWMFSGFTSKNKNKRWKYIYYKNGFLNNVFDGLLNGLKIHTSTVCVKKKLFDIYPDLYFREGLNNSEDREVWYKLCCIDRSPYNISKSLSIYDVNVSGSLTKNKTETVKAHFLNMNKRLSEFHSYVSLDDSDKKKFENFIFNFNRTLIKSAYIGGFIKDDYKDYLNKFEYNFFSYTINFNKTIKKIIIKLC
ncbi:MULTISPECIES: glycosyltransferase family 2 protein [Aequorivita]|uniref:Glycosyltransferase family 2 protein n=1 Tax=Aequorivita iocasae TaxID=2803865 RepID=A0ABX7DQR8_9FLAO|nr:MULTISPECIES: glycosyltransferase family 2 protein [Aequorivita]QQX75956.1 glycosyltransferase family 2 protein [Aequorivita iocasae]UCA55417.1 glycosyltransferase family 2 protein [Aequorivita sp. F7]